MTSVRLGPHTVTLPRGALYIPRQDEPFEGIAGEQMQGIDMVIHCGRTIVADTLFAVWLGVTAAKYSASFDSLVRWCEENPVQERTK